MSFFSRSCGASSPTCGATSASPAAMSLFAAAGMVFATLAAAQSYPSKPVSIVVPYQAGGATDSLGRMLAVQLTRRLGGSVIVENKPGADGRVGSLHVARSPADGHTVLLGTSAMPTWALFVKEPGIDPQKDLAPVSKIAEGAFILAANAKAPFKTLPEMIVYAKANPGKLNFATLGSGGDITLFLELIKSRAGVDITGVPYKGAEQFTALISGDVHMAMSVVGRMVAMERQSQARALAATGKSRVPELPAVPTFLDLGLDGFESPWFALFAPAATPREVIGTLNKASADTLNETGFVEATRKLGLYPVSSTPEELGSMLNTVTRHWKAVAQAAQIRPQ